MKRKHYIWLGLVFLVAIVTFTVIFTSGNEQSYKQEEKQENEQEKKDFSETEKDKEAKKEEPVEILTNTDPLNTMPDYIEEGDLCYEIDDVIKRGDCFQDVHSSYYLWTFNTSKDDFYFSYQHDQDHFEEIIYFNVLENDELGEVIQREAYEEYEDERGIQVVNDYWYVFSSLIPKEEREMLTEISWLDTGEDFGFYVARAGENITEMSLLISHNNFSYDANGGRGRNAIIHEYGHMLTLNDTQFQFQLDGSEDNEEWKSAEQECSTLLYTWGCLKEDSYLHAFYDEFWKDINADYEAVNWEEEENYKEFFFQQEDRFYNSYQGTSPGEDIADAFLIFVMQPSKVGFEAKEIKNEKLAFFYEYEELVDLRTAILENLFELNKKDEQFY